MLGTSAATLESKLNDVSRRIAAEHISGDSSPTDDHFSDAQEAPSDAEAPVITTPSALDSLIFTTPDEPPAASTDTHLADVQQGPVCLNSALKMSELRGIPGAFDAFDDLEPEPSQPEEPRDTGTESAAVDSVAVPTVVTGEATTPDGAGDDKDDAVTVKWNEEQDKIRRRVKEEKSRIEKLVQAEHSRSKSPTLGPAPRRSASSGQHQPIITTAEEVEETTEPAAGQHSPSAPSSSPSLTLQQAFIAQNLEPPLSPALKSPRLRKKSSTASVRSNRSAKSAREDGAADDDFGDDFDEFGEEVQGDDGFDDFEGFEEAPPAAESPPVPSEPPLPKLPIPVLPDFTNGDTLMDILEGAMNKMFPADSKISEPPPPPPPPRPFVTDRSLSLWNQLVVPPPLQPPNWKTSRIRRMFLVSLGLPVDLDEILPPETKQKKLVLPSVHSRRLSSESRSRSRSRTRRKKDKNGIDPDALDISHARILCTTSDIALGNLTAEELTEHVKKLEKTTEIASQVLTYWLEKRDSAVGVKESFEAVIESLVGYAKKQRTNAK